MYVDRKLQSERLKPTSFWGNTSSNELVINYIQNSDMLMQEEFETLMQGKSITKKLKLELTYKEMDNQDNVYSFLLLTGYLKIKKEIALNTYELVIPNKEVYEIYNQSFMDYFRDYVKVRKNAFVKAILEERVDEAQKLLSDILFKQISYYANNESFYHGLLVGVLDNYGVESNKEIGEGRADIIIYPHSFSEKAIVFECKHSKSIENMVNDSQKGAKQIIDKKYCEGIIALGYKDAIGYGISFYKKKCKLTLAK